MEKLLQVLKANVKHYRLKQELSQDELAEKVNISSAYLCDIEIGRRYPSLKTLNRFAEVLGIEVYMLLLDPETRDVELLNQYSEELKKEFNTLVDNLKTKY